MKTRAVILAGGEGSRLGVLTDKRAKPAVPFAGKYRIIDFTLSNCVNSGIFDVMILTQYLPHSLTEHIAAGTPWDLDRGFTGGVLIFPPYRRRGSTEWYRGTADAIHQNLQFLQRGSPDLILVLSGDHIYKMNYAGLIEFHVSRGADVTIGTLDVSREEATRMGILAIDDQSRVVSFEEKPSNPSGTLASMGIYVFSLSTLNRILSEDAKRRDSSHDIGRDILPRMVDEGLGVYAFPFGGYWVDVGTVEAYWHSQMALLHYPPSLDLNDRDWIIHTRSEERPPVLIQEGAAIKDSMITDGCVISPGARVEHSVLSPGVLVGENALIRDSVVLTDTSVESGARVESAILDKQVHVGRRARVGKTFKSGEPIQITTVGKNADIPDRQVVAPGAAIPADSTAADFAEPEGSKEKS